MKNYFTSRNITDHKYGLPKIGFEYGVRLAKREMYLSSSMTQKTTVGTLFYRQVSALKRKQKNIVMYYSHVEEVPKLVWQRGHLFDWIIVNRR